MTNNKHTQDLEAERDKLFARVRELEDEINRSRKTKDTFEKIGDALRFVAGDVHIPTHTTLRVEMDVRIEREVFFLSRPYIGPIVENAVKGPFTLGESPDGDGFRDINSADHPGYLRVVWCMDGEERSIECEKLAQFTVDALNGSVGKQDRVDTLRRLGRHVQQAARRQGWSAMDAEGAFEFMTRVAYSQGMSDARPFWLRAYKEDSDSYDENVVAAITRVEKTVKEAAALRAQPLLNVVVRSYPESNGKRNWTALIVRTEPWDGLVGTCGGVVISQGENWNRVAYEAERARYLLGLRYLEPDILDYSEDIQTPEQWKGEST